MRGLIDDGEFIPVELVAELHKALPDPVLQDDLARLMNQVAALDYTAVAETLERINGYEHEITTSNIFQAS